MTNTISHNQLVLNKIKIRKKANEIINKLHAGQKRKDGEDFVNHLTRVSKIIAKNIQNSESSEKCYLAGLLHDTIEDTEYTESELLSDFGEDVYQIVMECSEDKTKSWKERKEHTIEYLDKISLEALIVTLADKIDNLNSLVRTIDQEKITMEELFDERFNSSYENQKWYYSQIFIKSLKIVFEKENLERINNSNFSSMLFSSLLGEYKSAIAKAFGMFSEESYLNNIESVNADNYIPILMNRSVDEDTKIIQCQFAKTTVDKKEYFFVYESWLWDGIWGTSAIFINKQFEGLAEKEKVVLILKCLDFEEENKPKEGNFSIKSKGSFTFYNYNFYTSDK